MAKRTLTGVYDDGYELLSRFSKLLIKKTALVEGTGIVASATASVTNQGTIVASNAQKPGVVGYFGVTLRDGGQISNHGLVSAGNGGENSFQHDAAKGGVAVYLSTGEVANSGTLLAGDGGSSGRGFGAPGGYGIEITAIGSIYNSGVIAGGDGGNSHSRGFNIGGGAGGAGVDLLAGGEVRNKAGTIIGGVGGVGSAGGGYYPYPGPSGNGGAGLQALGSVDLANNALLAGGAGGDGNDHDGATGGAGVAIAAGSIGNAGTVVGGVGGYGGYGRFTYDGGVGGIGISASSDFSLTNTGVVLGGAGGDGPSKLSYAGSGGNGGDAIYLTAAGSITDSGGVVTGGAGGNGGISTVADGHGGFGRDGGIGIVLGNGGTLENLKGDIVGGMGGSGGYGADSGGRGGAGGAGVELLSGGTVDNFGAIVGGVGGVGAGNSAAGANGDGIVLTDGGTVVDGLKGALIEGATAVWDNGAGATIVINYGTIDGTAGVAVQLGGAADKLIAESGSVFLGAAQGSGGVLELAGGTGAITGLGSGGAASGDTSLTFNGFGFYQMDAGGVWTVTGATVLAATQRVVDAATMVLDGPVTNSGTIRVALTGDLIIASAIDNSGAIIANGVLSVEGAVSGAGVAEINGGSLNFLSSFNEAVIFLGNGTLDLSDARDYTGQISGYPAEGGGSLDLADIGFVGVDEATFSGTATSGILTVTDGAHTANIDLSGDYLSTTFVATSDGHGGTNVIAQMNRTAMFAPHAFISAMAGFGPSAASRIQADETRATRDPDIAWVTVRSL